MIESVVLTFMTLSTDYKRNSYLANVIPFEGNEIGQLVDINEQNYFDGFSRIDNVNKVKNQLFNLLNQSRISYSVYNNASNLLVNLPELVMEKIDIDNVFESNYGTLMVDFELKNNDLFSLEIGKKSIGYFSEVNDVTYSYCDELETVSEDGRVVSPNKLSKDLLDFLNYQSIA